MFNKKSKQRASKASTQQSGPVYSYYSNASRNEDNGMQRRVKSDNSRLKSMSKWWHNLPSIIATAAILLSLLYALELSTNPIIVQPSGANSVFLQPINTYQQAARKLFDQSLLNKNKITVNVSGITVKLKKQFPELSNVTITLPIFSHRPLVYIIPSQPSLLITSSKSVTYVLNDSGVAVLAASQAPHLAELKLPKVDDHSNLSIRLGQAVLSSNDVSFISTVSEQLQAQKQSVKSLTLPSLAEELDLQLEGQNYNVKMDMQGDAKEQVGTLLATIKHLKYTGQTPSSYIDVRVSGRAYYK